MTDRTYRASLGLLLLISLYFDLEWLMYGIILLLFIEGISNFRLPVLVSAARHYFNPEYQVYTPVPASSARFNIESERVWRFVVGLFLLLSYSFIDALWFFPWFMGFAIFGAGLSDVCPVLLAIRWFGFK